MVIFTEGFERQHEYKLVTQKRDELLIIWTYKNIFLRPIVPWLVEKNQTTAFLYFFHVNREFIGQ